MHNWQNKLLSWRNTKGNLKRPKVFILPTIVGQEIVQLTSNKKKDVESRYQSELDWKTSEIEDLKGLVAKYDTEAKEVCFLTRCAVVGNEANSS